MRVSLVPLQAGNLGSVKASLNRLGHEVEVWERGADVRATDWVLFPGVGALRDVRTGLAARHLLAPLEALRRADQPFLGICLGMQLLFEEGEEGGEGLGWLGGTIPKLSAPILPHMGWNHLEPAAHAPRWIAQYRSECFYFVHSFVVQPSDPGAVAATTFYQEAFPSVVIEGALYGVQFHPELSGDVGQSLLEDILAEGG